MDTLTKMVNFFKKIMYVLLFSIICISMFFTGCKYSGVANIFEQIAIYQNKGFCKIDNPPQQLVLQNVTININTTNDINNHLEINNIDCKINMFFVLYLQKSADFIDALIYIYQFSNTESAKNFYNYFYSTQKLNLYLYNSAVIQKGTSIYINNGATNYTYYVEFCNGLKK